MRKVKPFFLSPLVVVLLASGCAAFGGDMPVRVSGTVPASDSGAAREDCKLSLVRASTGATSSSRGVAAAFNASFVVPANKQAYYFTVRCHDGRVFRSRELMLGGRGSFDSQVELGDLSVQP